MLVTLTDLFPSLRAVPLAEVERAFKPALVSVTDEKRDDLASWLSRAVPEPFRLFSHLGHKSQCPRRYAVLWAPPDALWGRTAGAPVLSDGQYRAAKATGLPTFNLPRKLRRHLVPVEGEQLVMADIRACHPSVLAALAGDAQLAADARDGTLAAGVGQQFPPDVGKYVVLALVAGGGAADIMERAEGTITEDQAHALKRAFWSRYPAAHACLRSWLRRIDSGINCESSFAIRFAGWTPVRLGPGDLRQCEHPAITCWTAILRAAESALLDRMMVAWHAAGAGCVLPLFDGASLSTPGSMEAAELARLAESEAFDAGVSLRVCATPTTTPQGGRHTAMTTLAHPQNRNGAHPGEAKGRAPGVCPALDAPDAPKAAQCSAERSR